MPRKIPDAFVIVFALIILAAILTWVLPGGRYERRTQDVSGHERTLVVEGSYRQEPASRQHIHVFMAPLKGFVKLAEIVVFILLVGGAFTILNDTGAIAAGTHQLVRRLRGRELVVIPVVMLSFSFFGAAFGMCEEAMPFVLIFVPMALAMGYDSLVGVSMSFVAAGVGFAGAFLNPFTLQIAQGIAGVPLVSGLGYRVVVWLAATSIAIAWVMVYAVRVKRNPAASPMQEIDSARREEVLRLQADHAEFRPRHAACLLVLMAAIALMIWGVVARGWYIQEIGGLFLAMGIVSGLVSGLGANDLARSFVSGVKDMAGAALIVGFAGGILAVLEDGNVMDTILYGMASVTRRMPPLLSAWAMYVLQMCINFFIPSGSTKAALTMPIMAPLADLSGITRQTAVLAYQLGDGFTNMIIPTSGVTMGTLAMARIPFGKWLRWHLPMQIAFFVLSLALLVWPVLSNWP